MAIPLRLFMVLALVGLQADAASEKEQEIQTIEHAHAAVKEIRQEFFRVLNQAMKKGDLKKALPGCRIKDLKRGDMKVGRTSHRLRNPKNSPPEWTKPYLDKFSSAKRTEIPKHVLVKLKSHRYGYLQPIYVEPVCLNCHGPNVSMDLKNAILAEYPEDKATGFNVGDFRGLIWLEIQNEK